MLLQDVLQVVHGVPQPVGGGDDALGVQGIGPGAAAVRLAEGEAPVVGPALQQVGGLAHLGVVAGLLDVLLAGVAGELAAAVVGDV